MKAIIIGVNCQDGFYLRKLLSNKQIEVIGVSRSLGDWIQGSVSDRNFIENLIRHHQPDYIFNFAAISSVRHEVTIENHEIISSGSLYILESVDKYSKHTKVFLSGSALQFKNTGDPINENTPFDATSSYSVERIYTTFLARYYRDRGIHVSVGFLFNHESPLRADHFISSYVVSGVKKITQGLADKLQIGDLSVRREWNFAGDFARAIYTLMQQDRVFEAVIGSGISYTIKDWVEICFSYHSLDWRDYVVSKENYNADYKCLVSDPKLIFSLGYRPEYDINDLAELMMTQP